MVPQWHLIPYITERWAEIEGVDNIFMVGFENLTKSIWDICRRTRLVFEGKAFLQAHRNRFLTFPNGLPERFRNVWSWRARLLGLKFILKELVPWLHRVISILVIYGARSRYQLVEFYTVGFFWSSRPLSSVRNSPGYPPTKSEIHDQWNYVLLHQDPCIDLVK